LIGPEESVSTFVFAGLTYVELVPSFAITVHPSPEGGPELFKVIIFSLINSDSISKAYS
jgi:hypothetical protein